MQYLQDLKCPVESSGGPAESQKMLDWLLHYAVDLMHGDKGICMLLICPHSTCCCHGGFFGPDGVPVHFAHSAPELRRIGPANHQRKGPASK